MMEENVAGEGAAPEPQPDTLGAVDGVVERQAGRCRGLVGAAYAARIVRIEPKAHGGADILVEFLPRPPEHTLRIALGEETIEYRCRQAWWMSPPPKGRP